MAVGIAVTADTPEEGVNAVPGNHEYVSPVTAFVPKAIVLPVQIAPLTPAFAAGIGFTNMVTVAVPGQVPVAVTVYVVVDVGVAYGFAIVAEFKPVVGLHEYDSPATDGAPI